MKTKSICLYYDAYGKNILDVLPHDQAARYHERNVAITGVIRQKLVELRAYECMSHQVPGLDGGCTYNICCRLCYNFFELYVHSDSPLVKIMDDIKCLLNRSFVCVLCYSITSYLGSMQLVWDKIQLVCGVVAGKYIQELSFMLSSMSYPYLMCYKCRGLVKLNYPLSNRKGKRYNKEFRVSFLCKDCCGNIGATKNSLIKDHSMEKVLRITKCEAYHRSQFYQDSCSLIFFYEVGYFLFHHYIDYKINEDSVLVILSGYEVFVSAGVYKYTDKGGSVIFDKYEALLSYSPFKSRFPVGYYNIMSFWTPSGDD